MGLSVLALVACGGSADRAEPAATESAQMAGAADPIAPHMLLAAVDGCAGTTVHDNGQLLYVVLAAGCNAAPTTRALRVGRDTTGQLDATATSALTRSLGAADTTPVLIVGLGYRQVQLVQQGQWREVPHVGQWRGRDGAGLLPLNGALYLLGGWLYDDVSSEVWRTTDLVHWQFLGHAPWPARHGAGWLVHNNRLWVIGGDLYSDVWSSADGVVWTQEAAQAPFGGRYTPNAASLGGDILVYAGQHWAPEAWCHNRPDCEAHAATGVWKSRDGKTWTSALAQTPWAGRALVHGSAVWGGEIYVVGGGMKVAPPNQRYTETSVQLEDIWSSADGVHWRQRASTLGFAPRTHFSVLATDLGCYVSDGSVGTQDRISNDFYFAGDCVHFDALPVPPQMPKRHASSLTAFNGSLVLLGGPPYGNAGTSIWQYFP